jgi:hypothetical protein
MEGGITVFSSYPSAALLLSARIAFDLPNGMDDKWWAGNCAFELPIETFTPAQLNGGRHNLTIVRLTGKISDTFCPSPRDQ